MHYRFTIVAVAIAATCAPLAFAEQSPSYVQCLALIKQQKITEAEPICAQAAAEPGKSGKLLFADFLTHKEDWHGAIARYSEILKDTDPANLTDVEFTALRNRAMSRFFANDMDAILDARAVLARSPKDVELLSVAAQYSQTLANRLEFIDQLIALEPKNVEYQVWRVYALLEKEDPEAAMVAAEAAVKLDSGNPLAITARAYAWAAQGNYVKAEKDLTAVTRKLPNEPDAWTNRAEVLHQLERYQDSIESATKALAIKADHPRALLVRANAQLSLGNGEAALTDLAGFSGEENSYAAMSMRETAEKMVVAQNALKAESVFAMEQDRATLLGGMASYMHNKCGYFNVPSSPQDEPDNDGLHVYGDCLNNWLQYDDSDELNEAVGSAAIAAAERLYNASQWVEEADSLLCSKMPKKSKCIDDKLLARAQASLDIFDNPKLLVHNAEVDRLNRDIASYNGSVSRSNAINNAASFLQGVADALAAQ